MNGAIYLESLSDEQIHRYLKSLHRLYIWNKNIENESELLELVRKPLFLTMLVVAYQGRAIRNSSELFTTYIAEQLDNPDNQGIYPASKNPRQQRTLKYLAWLARKLETKGETEFLIEGIQPNWLSSIKQKIFYRIFVALFFSLIEGMIGILIGGFFGIATSGIFARWEVLIDSLIQGLIRGGIIALIIGLILGFVFGFNSIELREKISISFIKSGKSIIFSGLISGIWFGLWFGLFSGLLYGLFAGPFLGLLFGLKISETNNKNYPNQGTWYSLKNGLMTILICIFICVLIFGLFFFLITRSIFSPVAGAIFGSILGLILGSIFGLLFGLGATIQHFSLRLILYLNGNIPWNYAKFLEHAVKHRFIQRVGGRYRFMHDLLRKHFAQMPLN